MCASYFGDARRDPVQLQHSRFEEQLFRQRRLEAAEEGEASLRAETDMQERRKRRRADLAAEIARLQAEEEVSRPRKSLVGWLHSHRSLQGVPSWIDVREHIEQQQLGSLEIMWNAAVDCECGCWIPRRPAAT